MVEKSVHDGDWHPVQLTNDGLKIFHLLFADDVFLFAKAKPTNAQFMLFFRS